MNGEGESMEISEIGETREITKTVKAGPRRRELMAAWQQLHTSGTASPASAHILRIGLEPFLASFSARFLGEEGLAQGMKLLLGGNGEGKTHFLYCLREMALAQGHAVSLVEASAAGAGESWAFARSVLGSMEAPGPAPDDPDELRLISLIRSAVERRREKLLPSCKDPEPLLRLWAEGTRSKALRPAGLADAVADGILAVLDGDDAALRQAVNRMTFEGLRLTKKDAERDGSLMLRSLPLLVRCLGFGPLLILLDEAETAVEKAGTRKQEEFLKFVRFLNDHVANPEVGGAAVVVIACTDEFWPEPFVKHTALVQRLSDAGRDSLADRMNLAPAVLARLNKLWVRETFRGERGDYEKLGEALVDFAERLYPEVDRGVQLVNASLLAEAASSGAATRQVKRPFVKALAQTLEEQLNVGTQVPLTEDEAARLLDVTRGEITEEHREVDLEAGPEEDGDR